MTSRILTVLTGGLLGAAMAVSVTSASASTAAASASSAPPGISVTLLTGDRVLLRGPQEITVKPGPGRDGMRFLRRTDDHGDQIVLPADAVDLVSSGRLDPRLFNVTKLVEFGMDDPSRADIPLIVSHGDRGARSAAPPEFGVTSRQLPSIGSTAIRTEKAKTANLWVAIGGASRTRSADVPRIRLDGPVRTALDRSTSQIGAPQAWRAGHTGKGSTVAVLDSGIDTQHPDLADAVVGAKDFTDSPTGTDDMDGHGTHVASTITGSGAASQGKYAGVAPDTKLLNGKVIGDAGTGSESGIIAGMEWAVASGAKVVNMSLGGPASDGKDALSEAVDRLTEQTGVLFVVSAGNSGPNERTVTTPGAAASALTVGAVDQKDQLAGFSSRGPLWRSEAMKPDITAPGVDIVAARARNSTPSAPVGDGYARLSGTSMAAPHVAGAAAILAAQHPDWKADRLKAALMNSAKPNDKLTGYQQGAGRVDVHRATSQTVTATPASIDLGLQRWPHHDDKAVARTVTYLNSGTAPVTVDLAVNAQAPARMFTVQPRQLTIPAGGSAQATVTTDTTVDSADVGYTSAVTATSGGLSVRTPVGVIKEAESYDVKVSFLDREGKPTTDTSFQFVDIERPRTYEPDKQSSSATLRLPRGRYFFSASSWGGGRTEFVEPTLAVTNDIQLVLDARQGRPVGSTLLDRPSAREASGGLGFRRVTSWTVAVAGGTGRLDGTFIGPSRTSASAKDFTFTAEQRFAEPDGHNGFENSPYLYNVRITGHGSVPAQLIRKVTDRELAGVQGRYAATTPGKFGLRDGVVSARLPFTLSEFYTPGVQWTSYFDQLNQPADRDPETSLTAVERTFKAGQAGVERWNAGVFGPAFPRVGNSPGHHAGREGDVLNIQIPLFSDQNAGHFGTSAGVTGKTTLHRQGQLIATSPLAGWAEFTVPSTREEYLMHAEAFRDNGSQLSTKISADWTFRSGHADGPDVTDLPLLAVRFAPLVDEHNRARAGIPLAVPVSVHRNDIAVLGKPTTLTVQVSYDDGASWRRVPVLPSGTGGSAIVCHSADAKFVSLRATATDADGNKVDQTIIRAYALR